MNAINHTSGTTQAEERKLRSTKTIKPLVREQVNNEELSLSGHSSCEDDAEMDKGEGDIELGPRDLDLNQMKPRVTDRDILPSFRDCANKNSSMYSNDGNIKQTTEVNQTKSVIRNYLSDQENLKEPDGLDNDFEHEEMGEGEDDGDCENPDKNENLVEEKDFIYFKRQCKFEKFVTQLDNESPNALKSILGGYYNDQENKITDEMIEQEVVGFDTRFCYTKEGLLVYDVDANIKLNKYRQELNGLTVQDYKVFLNIVPIINHDKDMKDDYYQKFKSYTNALAPFSGLELANENERRIYEFLPPFSSTKIHEKKHDLLIPNTENVIYFNSEFESGNLYQAIRVSDFEYNLFLEFDKNSRNHTQWYYFACRNIKKLTHDTTKACSLEFILNKQYDTLKRGWHRGGFNISYKRNASRKTSIITKAIDEIKNEDLRREFYKRMRVLYTLTFTYTFGFENDVVFFAHFYPYTFTDCERYLARISSQVEFK